MTQWELSASAPCYTEGHLRTGAVTADSTPLTSVGIPSSVLEWQTGSLLWLNGFAFSLAHSLQLSSNDTAFMSARRWNQLRLNNMRMLFFFFFFSFFAVYESITFMCLRCQCISIFAPGWCGSIFWDRDKGLSLSNICTIHVEQQTCMSQCF